LIGELAVGSAWPADWLMIADGATVSIVRGWLVTGALDTAGDTTPPLASRSASVPLPLIPLTVTVHVSPAPTWAGVPITPLAEPGPLARSSGLVTLVLSATTVLVRTRLPVELVLEMPPPPPDDEMFPVIVLSWTVTVPERLARAIPPPAPAALFPSMVLLVIV